SHSEELISLASSIATAVVEDDDSLLGRVGALRRALDQLTRIDRAQEPLGELFDNAYYSLEELGNRMVEYAAAVEHDPTRLEAVRRRRDRFCRVSAKYGGSVASALALGRGARAELERVENAEFELAALEKEEGEAREALEEAARALTAARGDAASTLA